MAPHEVGEDNPDDPHRILRELRDARERDERAAELDEKTDEVLITWIKRAMVAMIVIMAVLFAFRFYL